MVAPARPRIVAVRGYAYDAPPDASGFAEPRSRGAAAGRNGFARARLAETAYARNLRALARHIGDLVQGTWDESRPAESATLIAGALDNYAKLIEPWATAVASRMLTDVSVRDARAWRDLSRSMGEALRRQMEQTATGALIRARLEEQVKLITSLPQQAGSRVMALAREGVYTGRRADEISAEIMRSGHVARSRANLIARTETGRAASEVTKARAEFIGSDGFVWRTAHDGDVRSRHRALEGKFFRWDDPPVAGENGERYLPGAGPNCRCHAEPVVPRN